MLSFLDKYLKTVSVLIIYLFKNMSVEVPEDKMENLNVNASVSVIKETLSPEDKEMKNLELSNTSLLLNEKNTSTEKKPNEKVDWEEKEGEEEVESSSEEEEESSTTTTSLNPIKDEVDEFKLHVQVDVNNQTSSKE